MGIVKDFLLVLMGKISIKEKDEENRVLKEENAQLESENKCLEEENRALRNKNAFRGSAPYERRTTSFESALGQVASVTNCVEESEIAVFKNLRKEFDFFCDTCYGSKVTDDRKFYEKEAEIYKVIYVSMGKTKQIDFVMKDIVQQLSLLNENLLGGYEKELRRLLERMHENYEKIFRAPNIDGYPRYDLVFPKEGENRSLDYDVKGKGGKVAFCLYPGIREIQINAAMKEQSRFRVKPVIWSQD